MHDIRIFNVVGSLLEKEKATNPITIFENNKSFRNLIQNRNRVFPTTGSPAGCGYQTYGRSLDHCTCVLPVNYERFVQHRNTYTISCTWVDLDPNRLPNTYRHESRLFYV